MLAAGGGARFTGEVHKLLVPFRGRPLLAWAIGAAVEARLDETIVVTGSAHLAELLPPGVTTVWNERWRDGMATSLTAAVRAAERAGHDAIVVGLGDQPLIDADSWRRVAASDAAIAIATYAGRRAHPVRLARLVWPLLPDTGDVGARAVMAERPDLVAEIACAGQAADIDTEEDLRRWS